MDFLYDFRQAQTDRLEDAGVKTYGADHRPGSRNKGGLIRRVVRVITTSILSIVR